MDNGKHRRKRIFQLEQDDGTITGQENLKNYITNFYRGLFGAEAPKNFSMEEAMILDIPHISVEENIILTRAFSEQEVHEAIMQMEKNEAPGPDGFPTEFYQRFWEVLKCDLLNMFESFHRGELPLYHLNFGHIMLLPKTGMLFKFNSIVLFVSSMLASKSLPK